MYDHCHFVFFIYFLVSFMRLSGVHLVMICFLYYCGVKASRKLVFFSEAVVISVIVPGIDIPLTSAELQVTSCTVILIFTYLVIPFF